MQIYSKNAVYQKFEVLKSNRNKRKKHNEFIIEGVRNINEAVKNNWRLSSFIYPQNRKLSGWATDLLNDIKTDTNYALADNLMAELSDKADTSELMAVVAMQKKEKLSLSANPVLVLSDRPSNKGNLGTLLRSCDALGVDGLIITGHGVDIYDPDVIGASTGSFFKLPFLHLSDNKDIDAYIADLRRQFTDFKVIGSAEDSETPIYDLDLRRPVLIMMGNEKDGLNRYLQGLCDAVAEIPMNADRAASSLNVSCAAAVVLYEVVRQRSQLVTHSHQLKA